jgi:muramoyltetrapeptide carboxypeptidase
VGIVPVEWEFVMARSKEIIRPKNLQPGDLLGVVAPAGPVEAEALEKGIKALKKLGFQLLVGEHVLARDRFLGGSDEERAEDLIAMFENPEVKGIICARGGYGVNRILHRITPRLVRKNPKMVIGASDITFLLLHLVQRCGLVGFHGPMVAANFGNHSMKASKKQFVDLLTGKQDGKKLVFAKAKVLHPGKAKGILTGGCLTLLCRSLGTPYEVDTRDKILFMEDVNEAPYRIDGMLWQLQKAGKFKDVRGILFGEMVGCHPASKKEGTLEHIYSDVFSELNIPILSGLPIGHGKEMWTLPIGLPVALDSGAKKLQLG